MDKDKISKELYEKVNEWFAEQPQRPIAQFMLETMWQYIEEAAQQSVQRTLRKHSQDCSCLHDANSACDCDFAESHSGKDTANV